MVLSRPQTKKTPVTIALSRPQVGTFCTASNRHWSDPDADDVVTTESFTKPFSSAPDIVTALNFIDIRAKYSGSEHTIGIKSSTEDVRGHQFTLSIGVWGDGHMTDNGCNWLALPPGDKRYRSGTYRVDRRTLALPDGTGYAPAATLPVVFDTPFPDDITPTVVVWLSGFQMSEHKLWHLGVAASAASHTGFSIKVSAPHAWLYQASIAWFAYVPGAAKSGVFGTGPLNSELKDYPNCLRKDGKVTFETPLSAVPSVMLGFCRVEMAFSPCVTVQVHDPMNVDRRGFMWKVGTWGTSTVCERVKVAYAAL